jgi:hypothetical protein
MAGVTTIAIRLIRSRPTALLRKSKDFNYLLRSSPFQWSEPTRFKLIRTLQWPGYRWKLLLCPNWSQLEQGRN